MYFGTNNNSTVLMAFYYCISYEGAVLHAKLGEEFQIMQTNKQQGKIYTVP